MNSRSTTKVAYLVKTFPKLSETFILNEILELERQGMELHIFSLREPSETKVHGAVAQVGAGVTYIPYIQYAGSLLGIHQTPPEVFARIARAVEDHGFVLLRHPLRYFRALLRHISHEGRRRHFTQAACLAKSLKRGGYTHLHAHFANEPASVAELAHYMTGCPYSFTAHAKDIYLTDRQELSRKIAAAEFVITCTGFNREYLKNLGAGATPIHLCYHGVDLSRFCAQPETVSEKTASPLILSVGRFCEKKGFPYLLQACWRLKQRGRRFVCRIVGFGPLQEQLEELIRTLQLQDAVFLAGKMTQDHLIKEYRRADLFVLPCLIADDGDRDGIPNVLVEAMAMRLPVVSTPISGIGELVDHMENGMLVPEKDADALAAGMEMLLDDPQLRYRLGANARAKVMGQFSLDRSSAKVRGLLLRSAGKIQAKPAAGAIDTEALEAPPS
jgi:glycosyltransferase involved in cell wall biosynthesis